jgi:hypothetical protein
MNQIASLVCLFIFLGLPFCRLLLEKEVMHFRLKVTNKNILMIGKSAERHCSVFMNCINLE